MVTRVRGATASIPGWPGSPAQSSSFSPSRWSDTRPGWCWAEPARRPEPFWRGRPPSVPIRRASGTVRPEPPAPLAPRSRWTSTRRQRTKSRGFPGLACHWQSGSSRTVPPGVPSGGQTTWTVSPAWDQGCSQSSEDGCASARALAKRRRARVLQVPAPRTLTAPLPNDPRKPWWTLTRPPRRTWSPCRASARRAPGPFWHIAGRRGHSP